MQYSTLRRHLPTINKQNKFERAKDLTELLKKEPVIHVLALESCLFDLRKLAFQLTEKYNIPHYSFYKFMKDNPSVSLRTPQATSMAGARGFNKEFVHEFLNIKVHWIYSR